jgi:hypothetical protein
LADILIPSHLRRCTRRRMHGYWLFMDPVELSGKGSKARRRRRPTDLTAAAIYA